MDEIDQPAASDGVRIADGTRDGGGLRFDLLDVLDALHPFLGGVTWEVRFISSVWMNTDPWLDSWTDEPLRLDTEALRERYEGQIINGRFTAVSGSREVLMVEAVDSSFWLVWSDDLVVLTALSKRFVDVTQVTPPTPFGIYG
jgi:hypothetical protein